MPQLRELGLQGNAFGDAGVSALAGVCASGALASLGQLWLSRNAIGDAGVSALANAVSSGALKRLEILSLQCNQISDVGVLALASALASRTKWQILPLYRALRVLKRVVKPYELRSVRKTTVTDGFTFYYCIPLQTHETGNLHSPHRPPTAVDRTVEPIALQFSAQPLPPALPSFGVRITHPHSWSY